MRVVHACWPAHVTAAVEWTGGVGRGLDPRTDERSARPTGRGSPRTRTPSMRPSWPASSSRVSGGERTTAPESVVLDLPTRGGFTTPLPRAGPGGRTEGDGSGTPGPLAGAGRAAGCGPGVRLVVPAGSDRDRLRRLGPPPGRARRVRRRSGEPGSDPADGAGGGPAAVWRPLLSGPDAAWARVLAAALPPALLAAGDDQRRGATSEVSRRGATIRWRCGPPRSTTWSTPRSAPHWERATHPRPSGHADQPRLAGRADRCHPYVPRHRAPISPDSRPRWRAGSPTPSPARYEPSSGSASRPPTDRRRRPGDGDEHWWLRFGLQATDEQSLVAEADEVWRATGALPGLGRAVNAPQETFLAELGKAAGSIRRWTTPCGRPARTPSASTWPERTASSAKPPPPSPPPGSGSSSRAGGPSRRPDWGSR